MSKATRKEVYDVVKELLGRDLAPRESHAIKDALFTYTEKEKLELAKINTMWQTANRKLSKVSKLLYAKGQDAEILEKHLLFLKKEFEAIQ